MDELPRSVLSGLTVDELPNARDASERRTSSVRSRAVRRSSPHARRESSSRPSARRSSRPLTAASTRCRARRTAGSTTQSSTACVCSRRATATSCRFASGTRAAPRSRSRTSTPTWSARCGRFPVTRIVLDGELVAFDASGHPSSQAPGAARREDREARYASCNDDHAQSCSLQKTSSRSATPTCGRFRSARDASSSPSCSPRSAFCAPRRRSRERSRRSSRSAQSTDVPGIVAKKKSSPYSLDPKKASWFSLDAGAAPTLARSRSITSPQARAPCTGA